MTDEVYMVVGDDGSPIGLFDKDMIEDEGVKLAFKMASVCDFEDEVFKVMEETMARVGTEAFGYVATSALSTMARYILNPALEVADAAGIYLRPGIHKIANGEDPGASA